MNPNMYQNMNRNTGRNTGQNMGQVPDHSMMNRRQLMDHINQVSFVINEITLYLDTHPCDTEALEYFREMSRHRSQALKDYAESYGPLTVDTAADSCSDRWSWINEP